MLLPKVDFTFTALDPSKFQLQSLLEPPYFFQPATSQINFDQKTYTSNAPLNIETSQLKQVILLTFISRFDFLSFEIIMVWYASLPQVIGQPLNSCQSYKLGGYLYGNDSKSYNAFVNFELIPGTHSRVRMKIRANSAGNDFSPSTGLTQGLPGRVKWRPEVQQPWGEYFDGAGNFKMNCK
jgi:hypothetical protein